MIYDTIHEIFTTLFIDYVDIPTELQPLIVLFELWGVFIFLKWILAPLRMILLMVRRIMDSFLPKSMKRTPRYRQDNEE